MATQKAPELSAQVAALAIAFVALSKFLGREQIIAVLQIPGVIESEAKDANASDETKAALAELVRRLRK
ncbi:MAG: hypothetical protein NT042_09900 [Sulfuritalea sp.]|nr:hypothetical protein [Sulfuritalea sp.]